MAALVSGVAVFFLAYLLIACIAGLVVAAHGYDLVTSLSSAFTAIGNVGPGLGGVGPTDHFAHFPAVPKLALAFCMLAGRLEIFTVLVIALLTLPAAIAGQFTTTLRGMMALASLLAIAFTSTGLAVSYGPDLPAGATTIVIAGAAYLVVLVARMTIKRLRPAT